MENQRTKLILILDGNSSHCLPLLSSFEKRGHRVTVICPGKLSCGYFSRYGYKKLIWPKLEENREEFYRLLMGKIKTEKFDLVMGLSDVSARLLSINKKEIEKYTRCLVPQYKTFQLAADKFLTMKFCMGREIPCPVTIDGNTDEIDAWLDRLTFPVVVKPKTGVGAVGFFIVQNREQLDRRLPALIDRHGSMLVQEYIPNENQYTVEAFCDHHSEMKACVVARKRRYFPLNGGTSSCIVAEHNPEITATVKKLLEEMGWVGSANIDLILDPRDGVAKVIEINPRVGATVKIAHLAGVDIADMTIKLLENEVINDRETADAGVTMRNLMLDLLWFVFTPFKSKWRSQPSFFQFVGKNVHYQNFSLDDPFPFFGYFMGNMMKYANFKRVGRKLGFK